MLKNKNFVKQYLQVPYFTDLMKLITRCRTFAEFEYEVNQELPQLVEESDGVVLEFYKEKNKEDVPIVSLMNCKILCKAVLSVDKYLFRAKKSIKEKLDRHFKSIISEMFDKATILKANAKLLEYESEDNDSEKTNTEKKKKKKRKKKDSDDEEDFVSDDENEGQKKKIAKKVEKNKKKLSKKTNSDEVFFDRLFFEELFEPDEIIYEKLNLLANKKGFQVYFIHFIYFKKIKFA
jgi:predicted ATP-dependent protease